ncbi:hypothetical protein [Frisingicoccus sp.]|uniref:hypothetical protein n=1 Tax=Frisingicoccus sp. TaxID=1918627 RepID=UPI00260E6999|nr:hypothetical protein [Frisingicoccus sp.]MDD6233211.1 hypothetical protein [Frisingicoccus sp.]MDY4835658.1 hypothetical protein [Frisingicoccus sp.]MDY4921788.1 hypothetical protein [Frisingicoccus sp.]
MDDEKKLTKISKHNERFIKGKPKTAGEVVEFMEHGAQYRSFSYLVSELYEGEDAAGCLRKGFCELTGEKDEKIRKNVQNWMNGKTQPQNRELLFQICFILGLDEEKSNYLLGVFSENRIHYRNPSELAYAFALRKGESYAYAVNLSEKVNRIYEEERALHMDEIRRIDSRRQENAENKENKARTEAERIRKREKQEQDMILYTGRHKEMFDNVNSEEEFLDFIRQNSIYLGIQHETAYEKFMELLNVLQRPEDTKYSMKEVVENYFKMSIPQKKRIRGMSVLQKLIKKCWPSETTLDKMKNRRIDVNRKTMILLYMLTEHFDVEVVDDEEYFYCDEEYSPEHLFEIRRSQMNLFLKKYGMNTLDYGNAFDLIVLYALYPSSEEDDDFAADRIDKILEILYKGISDEEDD